MKWKLSWRRRTGLCSASLPQFLKNMGLSGKRDLLSQGVVSHLYILKGGLIRKKPCVIKQRMSKSTRRLIECVIDKGFSGQLGLGIKSCSLWEVLSVQCLYDEAFNMRSWQFQPKISSMWSHPDVVNGISAYRTRHSGIYFWLISFPAMWSRTGPLPCVLLSSVCGNDGIRLELDDRSDSWETTILGIVISLTLLAHLYFPVKLILTLLARATITSLRDLGFSTNTMICLPFLISHVSLSILCVCFLCPCSWIF